MGKTALMTILTEQKQINNNKNTPDRCEIFIPFSLSFEKALFTEKYQDRKRGSKIKTYANN